MQSDMKDEKLKFWTTTPNVFLVATTDSGKVVGCISYEEMSIDTVEMHRTAVDSEFRNLGIGQKLVQALIDTAKENGYSTLYLRTSTAQIDAMKLYEKMNLKLLHYRKFKEPAFSQYFTGLKVAAYTILLK